MRRRRRLARLLDKVYASRRALRRELAWLVRDLRDWRAEWTTYVTLHPQPKDKPRGK